MIKDDCFQLNWALKEIEAKNIGMLKAYHIVKLKPEYAHDDLGIVPNENFWTTYNLQSK